MAKVPYDLPTEEMKLVAPPTFQAGTVAPGQDIVGAQQQALGRGFLVAGVQAEATAEKMDRDLAEAEVRGLDNQLAEQYTQFLHHPTAGYLMTAGKPAAEGMHAALETIHKKRAALGEGLKGDLRQRMFAQVANHREQQASAAIQTHAQAQAKVYNIAEANASVAVAVNTAAALFAAGGPTDAYRVAAANVEAKATEALTLAGIPLESAAATHATLLATTALTSDIVHNLVTLDNPHGAKAFLTAQVADGKVGQQKTGELQALVHASGVKGESLLLSMALQPNGEALVRETLARQVQTGVVSPEVHDATLARLEHVWDRAKAQGKEALPASSAALAAEAQRQTSELNAQIAAVNASGLPQELKDQAITRLEHAHARLRQGTSEALPTDSAALAALVQRQPGNLAAHVAAVQASTFSQEVKDLAITRLEQNEKRRLHVDAEDAKTALEAATTWALKPEHREASEADLPPAMKTALIKSGHYAAFGTWMAGDKGLHNNDAVWARITALPTDVLAGMSNTQFYNQYRLSLDQSHLERGYALLAVARGEKHGPHTEIYTQAEHIKTAAIQAGLIKASGALTEAQAVAYGTFQGTIEQRVAVTESGLKRKVNSQELDTIIDQVLLDKVKLHGSWFGSTDAITGAVPRRDLFDKGFVTVRGEDLDLKAIPVEARERYVRQLQELKLPITQQAIGLMWVNERDRPGMKGGR